MRLARASRKREGRGKERKKEREEGREGRKKERNLEILSIPANCMKHSRHAFTKL